MLLREIVELLDCDVVWGPEMVDGLSVASCFAADLMSDVLAFCTPGALLVTGLSSIQSAHTADVADLTAILFVANKRPAQAVLDLAQKKRIPLMTTKLSMFEACGVLYNAGLDTASRS